MPYYPHRPPGHYRNPTRNERIARREDRPNPTRTERIARREAREVFSRDSTRPADSSVFLQLASLQFDALSRTIRRRSRSASPLPHHRRSRSPSPPRRRSRSPVPERRFPQNHRGPTVSYSSNNFSTIAEDRASYNPFTITGRDPSPHQQAGATARPSPEAEESVIGWNEFRRERQPENSTGRTDSYRPAYGRDTRESRQRGTNRRPRGNRGHPRSLFDRITPRD
jgi:hypothetical protein